MGSCSPGPGLYAPTAYITKTPSTDMASHLYENVSHLSTCGKACLNCSGLKTDTHTPQRQRGGKSYFGSKKGWTNLNRLCVMWSVKKTHFKFIRFINGANPMVFDQAVTA